MKVAQQAQWQQELAQAVTDPKQLFAMLQLPPADTASLLAACRQFNLRVPRSFIARMRVGDAQDPLLLQVLPQAQEMELTPGYSLDPLNEKPFNPVPGLLHKYHGRVLLTVVGSCAVNCRYCFRRHFPYSDNIPGNDGWQKALDYIAQDSSIHEVILSGGDPLVVKDAQLFDLVQRIESIPQVKTLRFHTRLPIVLPSRVDKNFLIGLTQTRLKKVIVIHSNHANEIDETVVTALQKLRSVNVTLLNQSVILKGVNDSVEALVALSERLFAVDVLPYYLHVLDPVQGAAHFAITDDEAKQLWKQLAHRLPGYLVPRLAREVPMELSKTIL